MNERKVRLPQLVDELPFELKISEEEIVRFTELRVKKECFVYPPINSNFQIVNLSIMQNPGLKTAREIDLDAVEAYSLHVETVTSNTAWKRVITRVVLVTENGDRVLDTLVSPPTMLKDCSTAAKQRLVFKDQVKTKMVALASEVGPQISDITKVLVKLLEGKKVVAYHLPIRLQDVGIVSNFQGMPTDTLTLNVKEII